METFNFKREHAVNVYLAIFDGCIYVASGRFKLEFRIATDPELQAADKTTQIIQIISRVFEKIPQCYTPRFLVED